MAIYTYTNKAVSPDIMGINTSVVLSSMTNKNILYCNWDQGTQLLDVVWGNDLSSEDKTLLDTIVANNDTVPADDGILSILPVSFLPGTTTLSNLPLADTELPATQYRLLLDLITFTQVRVTMRVSVAGTTDSILRFQYALTDGGEYIDISDSYIGTAINTIGEKDSGWVDLNLGARVNDVRIRMMGKGGNGVTDPVIRQVVLHFR